MKDFTVEINPSHKIVTTLNKLRKEDPKTASMAVKQLFETTMLQSNLPLSTKDYCKRSLAMLDMFLDEKSNKVAQITHDDVKIERLTKEYFLN